MNIRGYKQYKPLCSAAAVCSKVAILLLPLSLDVLFFCFRVIYSPAIMIEGGREGGRESYLLYHTLVVSCD